MGSGYFARSWAALRSTPHWIGKLLLLSLVSLIPIFGIIAVGGYLWGWARDAAWGLENPLPEHIFGNEDGHQYSRGLFAWLIAFVFSLVPGVLSFVITMLFGFSTAGLASWVSDWAFSGFIFSFGAVFSLVVFAALVALSVGVAFLSWVGIIRMSIYATLSSGFGLGKLWAMIRRDPVGLLKILGMQILGSVVASLVVGFALLVLCILAFLGFFMISLVTASGPSSFSVMVILVVVGFFALAFVFAFAMVSAFATILVEALGCRAVGYWTAQFQVAQWRGQNDPLPFEIQYQ